MISQLILLSFLFVELAISSQGILPILIIDKTVNILVKRILLKVKNDCLNFIVFC